MSGRIPSAGACLLLTVHTSSCTVHGGDLGGDTATEARQEHRCITHERRLRREERERERDGQRRGPLPPGDY